MEFDTIYKFIAASFAIAYFIGLIIGIVIIGFNLNNYQEANITNSFYLTNSINFRNLFTETLDTSFKLAILPFSFLIIGIQNGFTHAIYILSPLLGQIKLAVLLIPEIFYFLAYILFSAVGLKLIMEIILFIVNKFLIKENKQLLKIKLLNKQDVLFLYLALISITIGTAIQIYLSKIFFIFLINFQLITYILIVLIYVTIISFSLYLLYQTIISFVTLINEFNKNK
ncbi:MAG: hypothetical protein WCX82_01170 [archaeon]|jgi:hypothetical protein